MQCFETLEDAMLWIDNNAEQGALIGVRVAGNNVVMNRPKPKLIPLVTDFVEFESDLVTMKLMLQVLLDIAAGRGR
jgi:hypothetical protein